jgi:hypothetical protein
VARTPRRPPGLFKPPPHPLGSPTQTLASQAPVRRRRNPSPRRRRRFPPSSPPRLHEAARSRERR